MLPSPRSDQQLNIIAFLTNVTLTDEDDYYEWELDGRVINKYSIGFVYRRLREPQLTLPWTKEIWFLGGIPKHKVLVWLSSE